MDRIDLTAPQPVVAPEPMTSDRVGSITLARHGEPALSRKCYLTSDQYQV
jgi:hypothetical protein